MVNPQIELLGEAEGQPADSSEVGRIVPIYEAMGGISSRMLRRIIYQALQDFEHIVSDSSVGKPKQAQVWADYRRFLHAHQQMLKVGR